MSAQFKTEHYEMVLKSGDMERCLPQLAWHLEEPRVGQSYPNYYAANLASKFVKVVFPVLGEMSCLEVTHGGITEVATARILNNM
jgi:asparagine synthase (glutamine-hydrolysing)